MNTAFRARRLFLAQLTNRGAHVFIWLYFASHAVLAVWTLPDVREPWPTVLGLLLAAGACVAITLDRSEPLSLAVTILVCSVGVSTSLLISWELEVLGYAQWYFGGTTILLFYVMLRGRRALAWVGFTAMATVIAVWGATTDTGILAALALIARQAPVLFIGSMFSSGLRRTSDQIEQLSLDTAARATAEAVSNATAVERARRLAALDEVATPLLAAIASGRELGDDDRLEFALVEGQLRDSLRARTLSRPAVVGAAKDARRRGVTVVLLDDSSGTSPAEPDLQRILHLTTTVLADARDGSVTVRLLPPGRATLATIVADGSTYARYEVTAAG